MKYRRTHLTLSVNADIQASIATPGAIYDPRGELSDPAGTDGAAGQRTGLAQVRVGLPAIPVAIAVPTMVVGGTLSDSGVGDVNAYLECTEKGGGGKHDVCNE